MAADAVLSRELKLLRDELAASRRDRRATPTAHSAAGGCGNDQDKPASDAAPTTPLSPEEDSAAERELHDQLAEFVEQLTEFLEDAERNIAAHPAVSIAAALLIGIVIGRLLGHR